MFVWDQHFVCHSTACRRSQGLSGKTTRVPGNKVSLTYITWAPQTPCPSHPGVIPKHPLTLHQINLLQTHLLLVLDCWRYTSLSTESTVRASPVKQVEVTSINLPCFQVQSTCTIFWTSPSTDIFINVLLKSSHSYARSNEIEVPWVIRLSISVV